eukprot:297751-Pleurochrysis_carterae.AAC.1
MDVKELLEAAFKASTDQEANGYPQGRSPTRRVVRTGERHARFYPRRRRASSKMVDKNQTSSRRTSTRCSEGRSQAANPKKVPESHAWPPSNVKWRLRQTPTMAPQTIKILSKVLPWPHFDVLISGVIWDS